MTNQERIKEYLVGENGYLKSDISNGKVIMLSGAWGSGKTRFWQNKIASDELKKELKNKREVYSYISLYGKTTIEEIENDIFSQAYSTAIGGENFITKGFSTFTKRMKRFGSSKIANGLKEEQKDNIERIALSRLNNGGIICFDDFERKSKDIDLNDLFGFITQLTLNFKCKVVIILNEDVFEGKEKEIFSNVKEKTVSKFLNYRPTVKELFKLIFFQKLENKKYKYLKLRNYKSIILKTIEETQELNARIYLQVFDNLLEWIENKNTENSDEVLRCLILVNINFILYHFIFKFWNYPKNLEKEILPTVFFESNSMTVALKTAIDLSIEQHKGRLSLRLEIIDNIRDMLRVNKKNKSNEELLLDIEIANKHETLIWSYWKMEHNLSYRKNISNGNLKKINNFIETGILIEEEN